jgi:hypothetical protein
MSVDLLVYVASVNDELSPKIINRLGDFGLECELPPGFSLLSHDGFLPIRVKVTAPQAPDNVRKQNLITGFECAVGDFDYNTELEELRKGQNPGFFQKLLGIGNKVPASPSRNYIADEELDKVLKQCKQIVEINSHSNNELLISSCFAAVVAELANGIVYDPQNAEYMTAATAIAKIGDEVRSCEELTECEPFTGWSEPQG